MFTHWIHHSLATLALLSACALGCDTRVRTDTTPVVVPEKRGTDVDVQIGGGQGVKVDVDRDRPIIDGRKGADVDVDIGGGRGIKVDVDRD